MVLKMGDVRSGASRAAKAFGRTLRSASPRLDSAVSDGWRLYKRFHFRVVARRVAWTTRDEARIDPYRVLWVDPANIEFMSKPLQKRRFRYAGTPIDGDWDSLDMRFEETDVYQFIRDRFGRGLDWQDIDLFGEYVSRIERGERLWDCTSKAEFERRCTGLEQLYENIATHGFKSQAELAESTVEDPLRDLSSSLDRFIEDEMAINIGRRGDLLACEGCDRLAMAKLLDAEAVPVRVLVRHTHWQRFRNSLVANDTDRSSLSPALQSHPDLPDASASN